MASIPEVSIASMAEEVLNGLDAPVQPVEEAKEEVKPEAKPTIRRRVEVKPKPKVEVKEESESESEASDKEEDAPTPPPAPKPKGESFAVKAIKEAQALRKENAELKEKLAKAEKALKDLMDAKKAQADAKKAREERRKKEKAEGTFVPYGGKRKTAVDEERIKEIARKEAEKLPNVKQMKADIKALDDAEDWDTAIALIMELGWGEWLTGDLLEAFNDQQTAYANDDITEEECMDGLKELKRIASAY